jgi:hypothetical protein
VHYVVNIKPQVVILSDMTLKTAFRILIESEPIVVADEALVLLIVNNETLLFPQLGKGINDDTEENV